MVTDGDTQAARLQEALARANKFLLEALPANRAGRLTPRQTQAIEREQSSTRRVVFLVGLVMAGGAAIFFASAAVRSGPLWSLHNGPWFFLVLGLLLMGLGAFWRGYQRDITEGAVTWVEGAGRKRVIHYSDDPDAYCYQIGGLEFDVSEQGYQALAEGFRYRAYYLPHSGDLVNIEVLGRAVPAAPPPTTVPVCPICGRSDRIRDITMQLPEMGTARGCATIFLPLVVLSGKNPLSYAQEQRVQRRQLRLAVARLQPIYTCRRDRVVFVPGAEKTVRTAELIRMLRQGADAETIGRALGVPPEPVGR